MSIARRLSVGGGSAFENVTPSLAGEFTVTAAPEGAWPSWAQAFYNSTTGESIFGFVNDVGSVKIGSYDHASGSVVTTQVGVLAGDQHNAPAVVRDSTDGRYITAMCNHAGSQMYVATSTNPDDITAWSDTTNVDSQLGGNAYTYPHLLQLNGETNDPIYLFYRVQDGPNNWCFSKTTDGGVTWTTLVNLTFGTRYYFRAEKTSETRFDFAVTDGSYAEDFASVYHFYYDGGAYHQSDGTVITSPPFTPAEMTLVYDGSTAGARFPSNIVRDGTDIAIVFPVQTGTPTNHVGEDGDYKYCRWDGATWTERTPATDVGMTDLEFTEGGIVTDPANINRVILSKRGAGGTGTWHLFEYVTVDEGANWTITQLTSTGDEDRYPWFVTDHEPELEFIWLKGIFIDSLNYDTGIQGWGAPS